MKNLNKITFGFIVLFMSISSLSIAQGEDAIIGTWLNTEKDGRIEIYKSGNEFFGKIVWLQDPNENGKPVVDSNNPDESLSSRPILGLPLLEGFTFEDGVWEDGTIYDPKSGKTYSCVMKLKGDDTLEVRGYVGVSMFGRTVLWSRYD